MAWKSYPDVHTCGRLLLAYDVYEVSLQLLQKVKNSSEILQIFAQSVGVSISC